MTTTNESSRRAFLAALAASGATAAVVAGPGMAHAAAGDEGGVGTGKPGGAASPSVLRTEAFPAPTPGTNYTFRLGGDFAPVEDTVVYTKGFGEVRTLAVSGGTFYFALNDLPPGAVITEVTFAVQKTVGTPGRVGVSAYRMVSGSIDFLDTRDTDALAQDLAEQYLSLVVDPTDVRWVVDNEQAATHWLVANMHANARLNSVRVGWTLARPRAFIPIAPKRVYDSRYIAPLGPLANLANRVVSVANGYTNDTATIDAPNVVPVGAKAIAYNITIANTVGSGFLSVNPGNAVSGGGSSINWFTSGLSLANGLVVTLDTSRQIKVFCGGGGSADFIIDILGYYI